MDLCYLSQQSQSKYANFKNATVRIFSDCPVRSHQAKNLTVVFFPEAVLPHSFHLDILRML
uniref:Uncharacterized protein n=1 Tax=Anguilla anguilla TaxID=7936 RepID=A0A0E9XKZ9_ANGAN